jgi:hypothetical protein
MKLRKQSGPKILKKYSNVSLISFLNSSFEDIGPNSEIVIYLIPYKIRGNSKIT